MGPSMVSAPVVAPMRATVVSIDVAPGDVVHRGQRLVVLESMKMEHVVAATTSGVVTTIAVAAGQTVDSGQRLLALDRGEVAETAEPGEAAKTREAVADDEGGVTPGAGRPDLAAVVERHAIGLDERRPDAVARRRRTGQRTRGRTSTTSSTPGRSWSTARW